MHRKDASRGRAQRCGRPDPSQNRAFRALLELLRSKAVALASGGGRRAAVCVAAGAGVVAGASAAGVGVGAVAQRVVVLLHLGLVVRGIEDAVEELVDVVHPDAGARQMRHGAYALCDLAGVCRADGVRHVVLQTDQDDRGPRGVGHHLGRPHFVDVWQRLRGVHRVRHDHHVGVLVAQPPQALVLLLSGSVPQVCRKHLLRLHLSHERAVVLEDRWLVRQRERPPDVRREERRLPAAGVADNDHLELHGRMCMVVGVEHFVAGALGDCGHVVRLGHVWTGVLCSNGSAMAPMRLSRAEKPPCIQLQLPHQHQHQQPSTDTNTHILSRSPSR